MAIATKPLSHHVTVPVSLSPRVAWCALRARPRLSRQLHRRRRANSRRGRSRRLAPAEVELNVINLQTTKSLPRHGSYFRLTHRFARDLRRGDFGQLAEDLFALDNGAIIGLEYRFGITSDLQAGVHRSILSRTIEVFGRYDRWRQNEQLPVSISLIGSIEGLDNLTDHFQPTIAASISRAFGTTLVLYTVPMYVAHTAAADFLEGHDEHDHDVGGEPVVDEHAGHDDTFMLGLGGRLRLRPSVFRRRRSVAAPRRLRSPPRDVGRGAREEDRRPHDADQLHQFVGDDVRSAGARRQRARHLSRIQHHPTFLMNDLEAHLRIRLLATRANAVKRATRTERGNGVPASARLRRGFGEVSP